jgi:hypothetical protein
MDPKAKTLLKKKAQRLEKQLRQQEAPQKTKKDRVRRPETESTTEVAHKRSKVICVTIWDA